MRDNFSKQTLDILAKRVGIRCSNPGCRKLTAGPRSESTQIINIGVGAHITAAASGGPRYNPSLSTEERRSINNGIWLCQNCAKLVDNDPKRYSIEVLTNWKQSAENLALSEIEGNEVSKEQSQENQINLEMTYLKSRMESERHDYVLEIKVQNLGNEIIKSYHVDLEFPARVIEKSKATAFLVEDRSNRISCFFRSIHHGTDDVIFPRDVKEVMSFPYYMDDNLYSYRFELFKQLAKATFYRDGFQPLTIEKPFSDLQFF
jgi:hypothetical protein